MHDKEVSQQQMQIMNDEVSETQNTSDMLRTELYSSAFPFLLLAVPLISESLPHFFYSVARFYLMDNSHQRLQVHPVTFPFIAIQPESNSIRIKAKWQQKFENCHSNHRTLTHV